MHDRRQTLPGFRERVLLTADLGLKANGEFNSASSISRHQREFLASCFVVGSKSQCRNVAASPTRVTNHLPLAY